MGNDEPIALIWWMQLIDDSLTCLGYLENGTAFMLARNTGWHLFEPTEDTEEQAPDRDMVTKELIRRTRLLERDGAELIDGPTEVLLSPEVIEDISESKNWRETQDILMSFSFLS